MVHVRVSKGTLYFYRNGVVVGFDEPVEVTDEFFEALNSAGKVIVDDKVWTDACMRVYELRDDVKLYVYYGIVRGRNSKWYAVDRITLTWKS